MKSGNLLRHYTEGDRVVSGLQRTTAHRHLLRIGYNQEQPTSGVLIAVTDAGRKALREAS
jgi:hypothetical protein